MTTPSAKVDAVTTKVSKLKLKGKCYRCNGDQALVKLNSQPNHQSATSVVKRPLH